MAMGTMGVGVGKRLSNTLTSGNLCQAQDGVADGKLLRRPTPVGVLAKPT